MFYSSEKKLNFKDVLIVPKSSKINSRKDVVLDTKILFPASGISWTGVPIMASNMDNVGTFEMGFALQNFHMTNAVSKFYNKDAWVKSISNGLDLEFNFITFGLQEISEIDEIISYILQKTNKNIKTIVFDIPNGYIEKFSKIISEARKEFPKLGIIAGNVVTSEGVRLLMDSGADGVKVGIGSGGVCDTTETTGIGYPQLSAAIDCSLEVKKYNGFIVSDGGVKITGDISKAFAAGSGFVMLGSLLAAHKESMAPIIRKDNKNFRELYGMSSTQAMTKHYGGVADYRTSEGKSILVEDRGPVKNTLNKILGALRSTCTYINAKNIGEIHENSSFIIL
ncbi:MAG: GMP reductase [SAR202 cluster bacterium]|jgi:GMP reductase|nr:GMP reductase [Chloroflexota bacterium]MQF84396.1 GMP reductase [SAR202 cluster bacterium]MQG19723.1 GMP reductase [SAR202 cluster bacterium]|tara:strand:+ start:363 stop:1376 length:1014 start_codon:yes stop_codon:yes gene_type:complete